MNKLVSIIALLAVLTSAPSFAQNVSKISDAAAFDRAKKSITYQLNDPGSAQFRNLFRKTTKYGDPEGPLKDIVCGEVNAKNSYGGYTGFTLFAYVLESERIYMRTMSVDRPYRGRDLRTMELQLESIETHLMCLGS